MNSFEIHLQSATQYEKLENVASFVGEDASGAFGIMANHTRFITTLVFGLARLRYADGHWDYLALPGGVVMFDKNQLVLSARRYLRDDDFARISTGLREEILAEERTLSEFRLSLERMEQAMLRRLWRIGRGEEERMV